MYSTGRRSRGIELFSEEGYAAVRRAFGGSPEAEEEASHVGQAKLALSQSNGKLNDWEVNFLSSMLHIRWPSAKQLTVLETLLWKSQAPKPKRGAFRGRRGGR